MRLTGSRCRCVGCGEHFNSASVFDRHRIGSFGTLRRPDDRRCLTPAEMTAKGWAKNAAGFWVRESGAVLAEKRRGSCQRTRKSGDRTQRLDRPAPMPEAASEKQVTRV